MMNSAPGGRNNQKLRTRKHLLETATAMLGQGRKPSLEDVAEEALVSRATAYRYFPNIDALLLEAALDVRVPQAEETLAGLESADVSTRLLRVEEAFHNMVMANETQLRMMLAQTLTTGSGGEGDQPLRQNRRSLVIRAALEPAQGELSPAALDRLAKAAALLIGPEALIVCRDVLGLEDEEARTIKQWAISALVAAARADGGK